MSSTNRNILYDKMWAASTAGIHSRLEKRYSALPSRHCFIPAQEASIYSL